MNKLGKSKNQIALVEAIHECLDNTVKISIVANTGMCSVSGILNDKSYFGINFRIESNLSLSLLRVVTTTWVNVEAKGKETFSFLESDDISEILEKIKILQASKGQ